MDQTLIDFVALGIEKGYIHPLNRIFVQNQLLELLQRKEIKEDLLPSRPLPEWSSLQEELTADAVKRNIIDDNPTGREIFTAKVMSLMTPDPAAVNATFWRLHQEDPAKATDFFYRLCRDNDYIKTKDIARNIHFICETNMAPLEITINLSKPEKDPQEIARAQTSPDTHYPKCQLCMENEGYAGHLNHPARSNHRIIRLDLEGETWGFQYSPYAYYNEHCIFLSGKHRPMQIHEQTFRNLLAILKQFPHYSVGSNADLPIVGGSILTHDHYQGGRHTFPMEKASIRKNIVLAAFPQIEAALVHWPLSVIRLRSTDEKALIAAAAHCLENWRRYSDEQAAIRAFSGPVPHNTITPIARRKGDAFELDLVLRNNRTTEEFPDGIFHPHKEWHHIKKENIGLIEAMGLAILPPRLQTELQEVGRYLLGQENALAPMHLAWAQELKATHTVTPANCRQVVENAVGEVFLHVLADAGVFKQTAAGNEAFDRFIAYLNRQQERNCSRLHRSSSSIR